MNALNTVECFEGYPLRDDLLQSRFEVRYENFANLRHAFEMAGGLCESQKCRALIPLRRKIYDGTYDPPCVDAKLVDVTVESDPNGNIGTVTWVPTELKMTDLPWQGLDPRNGYDIFSRKDNTCLANPWWLRSGKDDPTPPIDFRDR
ncbi:MAG: hypothetical protein Alpg2KO_17520 [Alphaproteobacteria bacterium]